MSASCEYYESLMSRMLDGDLLPAETDALRDHIRTCQRCGRLCLAFSSMTLSLRDDLAEPPAGLGDSVMARIRTWEAEQALESDDPLPQAEPVAEYRPRAGRTHKPKNRWLPTAVAACLIVIIGGTAVFSLGRGGSKAAETADRAENTASYSLQTAADGGDLPQPAAEAAGTAVGPEMGARAEEPEAAAPYGPELEAAEAEEAPMEEAADEETAAGYDLSNPAAVPEGTEAAFEALLTDAGTMPPASFHAFYAVEYRGVIYEFMTDEGEEYLLWRDAAEGLPTLSQSSFDDLWAIFK